jgi:Spy/CpxP family protein refolding chaperone
MNIYSLHRFIFVALMMCTACVYGYAQSQTSGPPPVGSSDSPAGPPRRPDLLRELGLSVDQLQQIRRINRDRKPHMEEAAQRLREANRNLDLAIYADNVDENEVQLRLKEFHAAQAEVARVRFMGELQIRRVLTPEQIVKFRDLRARFAAMMENRREDRRMNRRFRNGVPAPANLTKPNR